MNGAISGAGTPYLAGVPEFTLVFVAEFQWLISHSSDRGKKTST
jgi:hypothetical protein